MSLSDYSSAPLEKASWQKYEISPFRSPPAAGSLNDSGFVALQREARSPSGFVPIGGDPAKETLGDQKILDGFQEKTAHIEQEAYEKGFEQGQKDGFEIGEKRALKTVEHIEALFGELAQIREAILKRHEKEIIAVISAAIEAIVHKAAVADDRLIGDAIRHALELSSDRSEIKLRVNPDDYAFIENARPEFFSEFKDIRSIIVHSDPSIARGGCILETPKGGIDARIETRLKKIQQCLFDAYEAGGP